MAETGIIWGGWSGKLRLGVNFRWDDIGAGTTTSHVWADVYFGTNAWGYNSSETISFGGAFGGAWNYSLYSPTGGSVSTLIGTYDMGVQSTSYSGGPSWYFYAVSSPAYNGDAPAIGYTFTLPARPASVPGPPGLSVDSVTNSSARCVVSAAAANGSAITSYQTLVGTVGGSAQNVINSQVKNFWGGTGTVTGLTPATNYYVISRAGNSVGTGPWAGPVGFTTGATVPSAPTDVSVSGIGQTTVTVNYTAPYNGGSAITSYGVQVATDASFTQNVSLFADGNLSGLVPGTQYYTRVRAGNGVGPGPWSATVAFATLAGTPIIISPTEGQTVGSTAGYAYTRVEALGIAAGRKITAEFSQSSTFDSGVITVELSPSGASGDNLYILSDQTQYLKTGTWYVRAKVTNTSTGYVTPWSGTRSYIQSHIPSAAVQSPTASNVYKYTPTVQFSWKFTDASSVDTQTSYRLVIENNDTNVVIYDSNKTALATPNSIITVSLPIDAALKNVVLRWRVMTWDRGDSASAWSGYGLFSLADVPTVTILTPAPSLPVDNGSPLFSWSNSIPSGGTQALAVVKVFDSTTNSMVWSGSVVGSTTTIQPPVVILANDKSYYFTVDVTDSVGLTGTVSGNFSTEYQAPDVIVYSVDDSGQNSVGYVTVLWPNADADALFIAWKVYRRVGTSDTWDLIAMVSDQNVREYRDYMLISGDVYSYSVTQLADRSGTPIESPVGYYKLVNDEVIEDRVFSIDLVDYWIINLDDPETSMKLTGVISDPSTLEFESATYNIVGRGRHTDYGDELGYAGILTCQVRSPERPSSFRTQVETLRRTQETYYLRTPFGRLMQVSLGDIGWTPLAGVGTAEMGEITIPYSEVK